MKSEELRAVLKALVDLASAEVGNRQFLQRGRAAKNLVTCDQPELLSSAQARC